MTDIVRSATSLTLPWPPSVNAYKMPVMMGKAYPGMPRPKIILALTPRAREYRLEVADAIAKQLGRRRATTCYQTPVQVDIEFRAPDRRARDIDNHAKMALDGLVAAGILKDDALIDVLNLRRGRVLKDGCANVLISTLDREPEIAESTPPIPFDAEEAPF